MNGQITQLVRKSLLFHNLNKTAENQLGLSLVQYHLLSLLRDMPGSSPQRLAEAAGMHPSTLTQSLKRLQKKEAVFIGRDPKDSRKKILSVTRGGCDLLNKFSKGIETVLASAPKELESSFTPKAKSVGLP